MLKTFATGSRERLVDMKEDINGKAYHNIASKEQFLSFVWSFSEPAVLS